MVESSSMLTICLGPTTCSKWFMLRCNSPTSARKEAPRNSWIFWTKKNMWTHAWNFNKSTIFFWEGFKNSIFIYLGALDIFCFMSLTSREDLKPSEKEAPCWEKKMVGMVYCCDMHGSHDQPKTKTVHERLWNVPVTGRLLPWTSPLLHLWRLARGPPCDFLSCPLLGILRSNMPNMLSAWRIIPGWNKYS